MDVSYLIAAAGGGSSSFGGGGGGGGSFGGGGGSFGGGGYHGGAGGGAGSAIVIVVIVVVVLIVLAVGWLKRQALAAAYRRRRAARDTRVRTASAEAAEDDAAFAADTVEEQAHDLFVAVQKAWDARDLKRLGQLGSPTLMDEWRRRLADFERKGWHNRVAVRSGPRIEYVGLVNRAEDADDRCVVRLEAQIEDYVLTRGGGEMYQNGKQSRDSQLAEYWTLAKRADSRWILFSIEQDQEGAHNLDAEIVASPWADTRRLQDEALVEGAAADKALPGFTPGDLVDVDLAADARTQALDLALADGRFNPDLLQIAARRAVAAWASAVDGPDEPLLAVASPEAAHALLYPGEPVGAERRRLVVRGVAVKAITITQLDAAAEPARMHVALTAKGRRYVEDRDTAAVLSGSRDRPMQFTEQLVFALDGPDTDPWRVIGASSALA